MREHVARPDFIPDYPGRTQTRAQWLSEVARYGTQFGLGYLPGFLVELKPDLGDDYPAVLRQVKGYQHSDAFRCVVTRRHAFEAVTWEQVKKIFAASGITLIAESEIEAISARETGTAR